MHLTLPAGFPLRLAAVVSILVGCTFASQASEFIELRSESQTTNIAINPSDVVQIEDRGDRVLVATHASTIVLKPKPFPNLSLVGNALGDADSTILYKLLLYSLRFSTPNSEVERQRESNRLQADYEPIKDQINPILKKAGRGEDLDFQSRIILAKAYGYLIALESSGTLDVLGATSSLSDR